MSRNARELVDCLLEADPDRVDPVRYARNVLRTKTDAMSLYWGLHNARLNPHRIGEDDALSMWHVEGTAVKVTLRTLLQRLQRVLSKFDLDNDIKDMVLDSDDPHQHIIAGMNFGCRLTCSNCLNDFMKATRIVNRLLEADPDLVDPAGYAKSVFPTKTDADTLWWDLDSAGIRACRVKKLEDRWSVTGAAYTTARGLTNRLDRVLRKNGLKNFVFGVEIHDAAPYLPTDAVNRTFQFFLPLHTVVETEKKFRHIA
jgi:hypothetical protein